MKSIVKIFIPVLAIIVILGFTINSRESDTGGEPIKIGATLALSGNFAFIGEAEQGGLILAIEEINETGGVNGRPIELISEDNEGEAVNAVNGVQKLLKVDDVDVMFSFFSHITDAIVDLSIDDGTPLIYAASIDAPAKKSPLVFRDHNNAVAQGEMAVNLAKSGGYQRVGIMREKGSSCDAQNEGYQGIRDLVVAEDVFLPDEKDLRTSLLKMKDAKVEVIILCDWRHSDFVMRQMSELGMLDIRTIHFAAPFLPKGDTPEIRELYERNKALSTWYGFAEFAKEKQQQEFVEKYEERFGHKPIPDAGFSYDDMYVLADALRECSDSVNVDKECVAQELLQTDHVGVSGKLKFDSDGINDRDALAIEVVDGVWREVEIE